MTPSQTNQSSKEETLPPMPLLSISSKDTIAKCASFQLRSTDIFICSYPKSGTTWMQHMVLSLILKNERNSNGKSIPDYKHVSDYAPFFEIDAHWQDDDELLASIQQRHEILGRRVFNTHLRLEMLPTGGGEARFIYVMRSPLDTCVSFYHHLTHQVQGGYEGIFDDFFQDWLHGKLPFGSWMHHVLSFAIGIASGQTVVEQTCSTACTQVLLSNGAKLLLVSFHDMLNQLPLVVNDIRDFLQLNSISQQELQELLPSFTFASMRTSIVKFQPTSVTWKGDYCFLRKGISGDANTLVSKQQEQEFDEYLKEFQFREKLRELLRESHPRVLSKMESLLSCLG